MTFDHRGFGQSVITNDDAPGLHFAHDLRSLLDHLNIPHATIVGQSMGGWTALGCALRFPERVQQLVLCDTHGGLHSDEIAALWQASLVEMATLPAGIHPAAGERMLREQPALHFLYQQIAALNPPASLAVGPWLVTAGHTPLARASDVPVPVLLIAGEEDRVIPVSVLKMAASAFPAGQIAFVPRAGHSAYFERAETVNALIEQFLGS